MADSQELLNIRFKRFLHYGSESPEYRCGDRYFLKCYTIEKVPSLQKLIEQDNPESIVGIIAKVTREETSLYPDALKFALAVCAQQRTKPELKKAAYRTILNVCKTARDIILFVKFYGELNKKPGGGNGFKRAISGWYLHKDPFKLAHMFLDQGSYFGWSHADVLRIAHVKPVKIEHKVVISYALYGLAITKKKFGDSQNEEVVELFEYFNSVESIRKETDPIKAVRTLAVELHNIERVPNTLLKSSEVWNELMNYMDMEVLLANFQRLSILGFLKNDSTVPRVINILSSDSDAKRYLGHPSRIYIELKTYEKAATRCYTIASKLNHAISRVTPARKPPKCNLTITTALSKCFERMFKFQKSTNLRYFLIVDVRPRMFTDRCLNCSYLSPIEAAQVIIFSLLQVEPSGNVTMGTFTEPKGSILSIPCEKDWDIPKLSSSFTEASNRPGPASVASAIQWAGANNKEVDVFIVLSNYGVSTAGTRIAINKYRSERNLPNSKVVTCTLSGKLRSHKDVEGRNMQLITGFDHHVCRLIELFSRNTI